MQITTSNSATIERTMVEQVYNPRWYVIKTKPNAERQVAQLLESRQLTAYLPLLRRKRNAEPLFPGYLFLKIDITTDEYLRSRSAPGVSYFLSADGIPVAVGEDLIEGIRIRIETENECCQVARFKPGDRVIVKAGPFQEVEAIFDRTLTPQGRCLVLFQILGRLTRVQVKAEQLAGIRT